MKNKKITQKITQGMYVLTTKNGGCIVDAVSQISAGENPLISVSVMKKNYTNKLLKENTTFALSVLGKEADPKIIETFGMHSTRDINKFEKIETVEVENEKVIKNSLGYMILEKVDDIDNDTHILFIGKLIEADLFEEKEPMSYHDYQERKSDFMKGTLEKRKKAWTCIVCGYVYSDENIEESFTCPICGVGKELFQKKEQ